MEDCIKILLGKKCRSVQREIDEYFENKGSESVSRQGFAKARENIDPQGILELNKVIVDEFEKESEKETFKGYRLFSVDGSYISLPNSGQALENFGYSTNQHGKKQAKALAMTLYDSLNKFTIHAELYKRNDSEKQRIFEFVDYVKKQNYKDVIFVLDRGYPSFKLMKYIEEMGYKYVIRVQSNFSKITTQAEKEDNCVETNFNNNKENINIKFRVVNIKLKSGVIEKIVTNLGKDFSVLDINNIYQKRWEIETSFDLLKNKVCLESFSGQTKIAILQDFYAAVIIQNLVLIANDEQNKIIHNSTQKQPNITKLVSDIKLLFLKAVVTKHNLLKYFYIIFAKKYILKYAVYSPPNRSFPRCNDHRSYKKFSKKSSL